MTAFVARLRPDTAALFDTFAITASCAFLARWPGRPSTMRNESPSSSARARDQQCLARLGHPRGHRADGGGALLRLLRVCTLRQIAVAALGTVALVAAFWLAGPVLAPLGKLNLLIFFVGVVAFTVFAGVAIAFSFALATFGYLALTTRTPMLVMVGRLD